MEFTNLDLRALLDSAPDAMAIVDPAGEIVAVNRQTETLFGYARIELIGRKIETLIPERYRDHHLVNRASYSALPRTRAMGAGLELYARRKDGSEFPVEISLSPVSTNDRIFVASAIRDITDQRQLQQHLEAAKRAAEHADLAKSRFLAAASHDLRQPLQTLTLLNRALGKLVDRNGAAADVVRQQALAIEGMIELINCLLDISRLESGVIQPYVQDFPIQEIFDRIEAQFSELAKAKGLSLDVFGSPVVVRSDPALLADILQNLLANAIRYTSKGAVRLSCIDAGEHISIEVADTGVGITADHLQNIFEEFHQVQSSVKSHEQGWGLGLFIVKRTAQLLGHAVKVRSVVGQGSVFSLEVPYGEGLVSAAGAAAMSVVSAPADKHRTVTVLLVDDDPAVRSASQIFLELEGFDVISAETVDEVCDKISGQIELDVVVTDYHLGRSELGTDVVAAVRRICGRNIPALILSGDTSPAVSAMVGGLADCRLLSKPVDVEKLLQFCRVLTAASGSG